MIFFILWGKRLEEINAGMEGKMLGMEGERWNGGMLGKIVGRNGRKKEGKRMEGRKKRKTDKKRRKKITKGGREEGRLGTALGKILFLIKTSAERQSMIYQITESQ